MIRIRATRIFAFIVAIGCTLASMPRPVFADELPKDKAGLDAFIKDFILKNPEIIRDAVLKLQNDDDAERAKKVLQGVRKELYDAGSPELGISSARISIVEFYDYNCPYCRASYPVVAAYLKAHPDTKLVLKDVASFGKDSEAVAKLVLAASKSPKLPELHTALMSQKGKLDEARALKIAESLGFDANKLKSDAQSGWVAASLEKTQELANRLSLSTTPMFIIGHNGIVGVPDDFASELSEKAEEVRKSGCDAC